MKTKNQLADEIYQINRLISLYWIGLKEAPTEEQIATVNRRLGEIIKELRESEDKL